MDDRALVRNSRPLEALSVVFPAVKSDWKGLFDSDGPLTKQRGHKDRAPSLSKGRKSPVGGCLPLAATVRAQNSLSFSASPSAGVSPATLPRNPDRPVQAKLASPEGARARLGACAALPARSSLLQRPWPAASLGARHEKGSRHPSLPGKADRV